jgi:hypothetical protein
MPGALMQLAQVGAQNTLVNGNPSMTHFRAVYRRHTNFAMEHVRMSFSSSNLEFVFNGTRTLSCKIDRYAQLLHDTYFVLTLPDIWSPMAGVSAPPAGYDSGCTAMGYEFQWIKNIGYNLIDHIEIVANGTRLQVLTGEWMKMYSYFTHDENKRRIVDNMVGNVPEMYDPANAYDRTGQYPHAVTPTAASSVFPFSATPEPSIRSRQLVIPLHFWFCENPGLALPLVSMQNSEVYINIILRPLNQLYTIIDVNPGSQTAAISSIANTGSTSIFTTSAAHNYVVGFNVTFAGPITSLTGPYTITAVTTNTFTCAVASPSVITTITTATSGSLSYTLTSVAPSGNNTIFTTSTTHALVANSSVTITGPASSLNGTYTIVSVTSNTFTCALPTSYNGSLFVTVVSSANPTYGQRIRPTNSQPMNLFLSPPSLAGGNIANTVNTFFPDPYLEGNFIYLTDMEMNQLATADQTFLLKEVRYVNAEGQYGANTDINIPMFNLVTRVVFTAQRSDKILTNDWDNYTNWVNPERAPFTPRDPTAIGDTLFSSGQSQISSVYPRDAIADGILLFEGNLRFQTKPSSYFSLLQSYKHSTGSAPHRLPGAYMYSFALNHDQYQPSGAINGSMFNKVTLRVSLQQPIPSANAAGAQTVVTILKATAFSANPVVVAPADCPLYTPDALLTVVQSTVGGSVIFSYTYNVGVYVESINYLRIVSGIANLVFAS